MKNFYRTKSVSKTALITLTLAMLVSAGFYACKKPTDGIDLIVNTGVLSKSPVLLHFNNANPTSTNQPGDFNVTITGRDSALVSMDGGSTKFTASHGFLPLSLSKNSNASTSSPVVFNVTASVPGFTPVTKTVYVTGDATQVIEINMIEYANPAAGTLALVKSTALSGGTSAAVSLTTTPNASLTKTATLSIPAGTQMLDAAGRVINASALNSSIVQFSSGGTPSIIQSFPGNLKADLVRGPDGKIVPGGVNFVTAGMLAINMTADNTPVKSFSKPLAMSVQLQDNLTNFYTGNPVAVGDTIPMWSYNENNGEWKRDGLATVALGTGGQLVANTTISHLSYWNIDFMYYGSYYVSNSPTSINLVPTANANTWNGNYYIMLQSADGNYLTAWSGYRPQYDYFQQYSIFTFPYYYYGGSYNWYSYSVQTIQGKYGIGVPNLPKAARAKVVVYDYSTGKIIGESGIFNTASGGAVNVSITPPPPPDYVDVYFNVTTHCTTKNINTSPSGWYFLQDYTAAQTGQYGYTYFYLYNGVIYNNSYNTQAQVNTTANGVGGSIKMVNGHQYYLYTYYNNTWLYTSFTFNKSSFAFPSTNGLSGSATYNSTDNSINIKAMFNANCN